MEPGGVADESREPSPPASPSSAPPTTAAAAEPEAREEPPSLLGTAKTIAFIAAIQVFALLITKVNAPAIQASGYTYAPAGTSSSGSVYNVAILVALVFTTTLVAVWLARKKRARVFAAIVYIGTGLALFLLTLISVLQTTSQFLSVEASIYVSIAVAGSTLVLLAAVGLRRAPPVVALAISGLLSAEVGSYFASTIPILTALLLPIGFSLYDMYTVFRGPLKTLITTLPAETLGAISSKVGDFSIGTGDTVFYAMMPALGYYQFGLGTAFAALLAVDAGVAVTLHLLARQRLLPGLPIPMFMGLAVLVAALVI